MRNKPAVLGAIAAIAATILIGAPAPPVAASTGPIPLNCDRAHAVFDQGTVNKGILSDGRPYEFKGFNRPSSILVTEVFLIENGKIRRVEAVAPSASYHLNSPWPGNLNGD
jgi:hypothetical protein